jgi:hypothetical protein
LVSAAAVAGCEEAGEVSEGDECVVGYACEDADWVWCAASFGVAPSEQAGWCDFVESAFGDSVEQVDGFGFAGGWWCDVE